MKGRVRISNITALVLVFSFALFIVVSIFGTFQETYAATSVKVGNFLSGTATGDVNVTGVGFQPKAVIFFWTRQSSTGFATGDRIGEGFAAGLPVVNRGVSIAGNDNSNGTVCGRRRSETYSIIFLSNGTPTLSGQGSVTSFDSDGFTINWNTAPAVDAYINYMAIGGDDITDVSAGTITAAALLGNQSFTGVGFQPDFVMFLSGLNEGVDTNTANMLLNTGFMTSAEQAAVSVCGRTAVWAWQNNYAQSQQRTDRAIMGMTTACGQDSLASYVSMDADGFTLNFSDAPAANTPIFYLAIEGGTHRIGSFTQPVSGSVPFTEDYVVGFQPVGLLMASFNRTASTSIGDHGELSVGTASSSTERVAIWGEHRDAVTPSDANMSIMTDRVIQMATGAGAAAPTINAEADFSSFLSNGFRLNWTTIDATARQIVYWAITNFATTIGDGANPGDATLGPGGGATMLDAFTLKTSTGTDTVSGVTVTLSSGSSEGLSLVEITDDGGSTVYGSAADPASDTVSIPLGTNIPVTTTATQYKVRITPKSHAGMPVPPGSAYPVTGTVTDITNTNPTKVYSDSSSATITIDNQSPANPTGFSGSPGDGQVELVWTNPVDADFSEVVLLRNTSVITDAPVEGASYLQNDTIGTSTVRYAGSLQTFTDTGLTNGAPYYYKIFAKDSMGNYSTGSAVSYTPGTELVTASSAGAQTATIEAGSTTRFIGAAFTFQQSSGTADTISALTISETGTAVANAKLTNVKVYYENGVASCAYNGTEALINTSFDASDKIVMNSLSIPVTLSPNYTCVYVVFDVDLSAINNSTVDLQITGSADFTLSNSTLKAGWYPVALSGSTKLVDTTAPGNITGLTVTPGDGQIAFSWTNPSAADFAGVRIRRNTGSTPPNANCTNGTQIADIAAPGTSYTNTGLTNNLQYSYRFCSYDEVPNYSSGVTASEMPSIKPLLRYPPAPYDDGKERDIGDTTSDFRFKLQYYDWQNDAPASGYPKIYIGDNDGYGYVVYSMSVDADADASLRDGNFANGEQYVYGQVGLGAAEDSIRFYFEAQAVAGDPTVVTLPSTAPAAYNTGPTVFLIQEYNMVGVPKDLGSGLSYYNVLGDDSGYLYCSFWDSTGLDTVDGYSGDFTPCTYGNVETGKGYYIWALDPGLYMLDEPAGVENVTDEYVDIALDPDGGWTMISNPYNARIELQNVKVVRNATVYDFSYAVTNNWIENSIYEWEGPVTGYTYKAYNDTPPAVFEPWVGYFIYVKDATPTTLRIYKPAP